MTAIPITDSAIRNVKRSLQLHFPEVKSAHLTEALAAACGYNTHAALCAELRISDPNDPNYVLLDPKAFFDRLADLTGRAVSSGQRESFFDHLSYSSSEDAIKTSSPLASGINYARSGRQRAWRNTMVAGINAGIDRRLFTIRAGDNRWSGATTSRTERGKSYVYSFTLEDIPAIASVNDAGHDELSIHVALWPTPDGGRWVQAAGAGFLAGELYASGWLERRDGAWLQVTADKRRTWNFRCRNNRLDRVASLTIWPKGYADRGDFKL